MSLREIIVLAVLAVVIFGGWLFERAYQRDQMRRCWWCGVRPPGRHKRTCPTGEGR